MSVIFSHIILSRCVSSRRLSFCYLTITDQNNYVVVVCRYDYLRISNDNNYTTGTYCGVQSGRNIIVTGRSAVLTFHSDVSVTRRGYKLIFSFVPGKYKESDEIIEIVSIVNINLLFSY